MQSSYIFTDKNGNIVDREEAVSMPSDCVRLIRRSKMAERYANDFMLVSARLSAASLIILEKRLKPAKITEKNMYHFRSVLREYLSLIDEIINKEQEMDMYVIGDDPYMIMMMYRTAFLVRKTCRCRVKWYGKYIHIGHFEDYDFGIDRLKKNTVFTGAERKLFGGLWIDPKIILKLAYIRMLIKDIPLSIRRRKPDHKTENHRH